jgi:hypothetical protein
VDPAAFDPQLYVLNADGQLMASDSTGPSDRRAVVNIHLPPGSYTLLMTSRGAGTGTYKLSVVADLPRQCFPQTLSIGSDVDASFDGSDCRSIDTLPFSTDTTPFDFYVLTAADRKVLSLRFTSPAVAGLIAVATIDGSLVGASESEGMDRSLLTRPQDR